MKKKLEIEVVSVKKHFIRSNNEKCTNKVKVRVDDDLSCINEWYSPAYVEELVNEAVQKANNTATAEYLVHIQKLNDEISDGKMRIRELEVKINMMEPMKEFTVTYGTGFVETVMAHNHSLDQEGCCCLFTFDGKIIASFNRVLAVTKEK